MQRAMNPNDPGRRDAVPEVADGCRVTDEGASAELVGESEAARRAEAIFDDLIDGASLGSEAQGVTTFTPTPEGASYFADEFELSNDANSGVDRLSYPQPAHRADRAEEPEGADPFRLSPVEATIAADLADRLTRIEALLAAVVSEQGFIPSGELEERPSASMLSASMAQLSDAGEPAGNDGDGVSPPLGRSPDHLAAVREATERTGATDGSTRVGPQPAGSFPSPRCCVRKLLP